MSAGHKYHAYSLSTHELEEALSDTAVEDKLMEDFKIDTTYDIPFLAGYSKDGKTRYIDRHFYTDNNPVGTIEINNETVDTTPYLVGDPDAEDPIARGGHEGVEKACEQLRTKNIQSEPSYDYRHVIATAAERRLVIKDGLNWQKYQQAYKPFIKADETEKITKLPLDLDMTPYDEDGNPTLLAHMHKLMHEYDENQSQPQKEKDQVNYSKGTTKEHCGNCEHFEALHKNGCELVKGFIKADMWCRLWKYEEDEEDEYEDEE